MTRRRDIISQFNNVVAGQRATAALPVDRRYHVLKIKYSEGGTAADQATMEASITQIKVLINGKEQRVVSAAELIAINLGYGQTFRDGILSIYFSEPWRRLPASEDFGAWNLRGRARDFTIEVDIDAGAVNPKLELLGKFDIGASIQQANSPFPPGTIKKYVRKIQPVTAIGLVTIDDLPQAGAYTRIHAFEVADGDVKSLVVKVADQVLYNWPRDLMIDGIEERGGTVPVKLFTAAFDETNSVNEFLRNQIVENRRVLDVPVRLEYDMAVANTLTLVHELWAGF